jgi:hypothetical protein
MSYYITTKSAVTPFALLGTGPNRTEARELAKKLGGTVRTEAEYNELLEKATLDARLATSLEAAYPTGASQVLADEIGNEDPTDQEIDESNEAQMDTIATNEEVQESGDLEDRLGAAFALSDAQAKIKEAPKTTMIKVEPVAKSTTDRPCKLVWAIADEMFGANPNTRRKDVLEACVNRGVAFYTARTQYQQWLSVQKEMAEREAAQAK